MKDELLAGLFPIVCGLVAMLIMAALIFGVTQLLEGLIGMIKQVVP